MSAHAHDGIRQGVTPFLARKLSDSRYAKQATAPPKAMMSTNRTIQSYRRTAPAYWSSNPD
jgi:hypothetical protein